MTRDERKKPSGKKGGGSAPYAPTEHERRMVERLVGMLVPQEAIARDWFNPPISIPTLRKYFAAELIVGRDKTQAWIKSQIMRAAANGSLRALIYLSERLIPEFIAQRKATEFVPLQVGAGTTITIRGGLPPVDDDDGLALRNGSSDGTGHSSANGAETPDEA